MYIIIELSLFPLSSPSLSFLPSLPFFPPYMYYPSLFLSPSSSSLQNLPHLPGIQCDWYEP